jgi:hypothetical protein
MNVFTNLDREQAAMYRWIRDTCDASTFRALAGQMMKQHQTTCETDHALREAYHRYTMPAAGEKAVAAATMSAGILPSSLGLALTRYTEAVEACATFAESFGGPTFSDVNHDLENAMLDLVDEMRKLQS